MCELRDIKLLGLEPEWAFFKDMGEGPFGSQSILP